MRVILKVSALAILVLAVCAGAVVAMRHVSLQQRLAAQPMSVEAVRWLQAIKRDAAARNSWINFTAVSVPSAVAAAQAVRSHRADLAILRADVPGRAELQSLGILGREHVFLIVPAHSSIDSFKAIANQRVAMLPSRMDNDPLLNSLLEFYGVPPASVTRSTMSAAEIGSAIQQRRIAAVFVVGVPGRGAAAEAFAAVSRAGRAPANLVGVEEAEALAARLPSLDAGEIGKGAFAGRAPNESVATVTLAHHLVADRTMSNWVAGQVSRSLMDAKANLIGEPGAVAIEALDTEQTNYAIHPGARAYFDGEQTSVLDSLTNLFWIGSALIGLIGSAVTWIFGRLVPGSAKEGVGLEQFLPLLRGLREADGAKLDELSETLDDIFERAIVGHQAGKIASDELGACQVAFNYARQAILNRRAQIAGLGDGP